MSRPALLENIIAKQPTFSEEILLQQIVQEYGTAEQQQPSSLNPLELVAPGSVIKSPTGKFENGQLQKRQTSATDYRDEEWGDDFEGDLPPRDAAAAGNNKKFTKKESLDSILKRIEEEEDQKNPGLEDKPVGLQQNSFILQNSPADSPSKPSMNEGRDSKRESRSHSMVLADSGFSKIIQSESGSSSDGKSKASRQRDGSKLGSGQNSNNNEYPSGYSPKDDLNGDGRIDSIEKQIKHNDPSGQARLQAALARRQPLKKLRREVDFHHKVAYRFEKAYRLGRVQEARRKAFDLEIIQLIDEHSEFIQADPMALFYCLYFCILYNNPFIVEFLRVLIHKIEYFADQSAADKIEQLVQLIDVNGLERLRSPSDKLCLFVYHIVLFQAFQDELRVVYSKILSILGKLEIRDSDAKHLLLTRDYELIRTVLKKRQTHIDIKGAYRGKQISASYRHYNVAFFEEVLLTYSIEERVANNFRERFLVTREQIYEVLEMYSKMDYIENFLKVDISAVSCQQLGNLFCHCLKNDSMKIALELYANHLRSTGITSRMITVMISSLGESVRFHEGKLFLIHEHLDQFSMEQLTRLVDLLCELIVQPDYKQNPFLSQYNTVKYALLIFRISWRVRQKNIYSLITKCQIIDKFVIESLQSFLSKQENVTQLHRFMVEPILDWSREYDSLDLMLEMKMDQVLNHPILIEVLNLIYEGQYSADTSMAKLSHTFECFLNMSTFDLKLLCAKMVQNIRHMGEIPGDKRQSSLQFNIWKHCIEQRQLDEAFLTIVLWLVFIVLILAMNDQLAVFQQLMDAAYSFPIMESTHLVFDANQDQTRLFCSGLAGIGAYRERILYVEYFTAIYSFGMGASVLQKILSSLIQRNAKIQIGAFILEAVICVLSTLVRYKISEGKQNPLLQDLCSNFDFIPAQEMSQLGKLYYLATDTGYATSFQTLASYLVLFVTLHAVLMLKRFSQFRSLLEMSTTVVFEFGRFIATFGALVFTAFIILRLLHSEIQNGYQPISLSAKDIFNGFNGLFESDRFVFPAGQAYIAAFQYLSEVFLMGFLTTMFILRSAQVYKSMEANRRKEIIAMKNSTAFNSRFGSVTITFFPINVLVLPAMIPLAFIRLERVNDFFLKIQYGFLIVLYIAVAATLSIPLVPLLYFKMLLNAIYHWVKNKRVQFKGEGGLRVLADLLLGPLIILGSLAADFLNLNTLLMLDEKHFEFKYQYNNEVKGSQQEELVRVSLRNYVATYKQRFQGLRFTNFEIMQLHVKLFRTIEYFHSLFCRGDMSYKDSTTNIQKYNLSKKLTYKCCLPNKQGIKKLDVLDYDILSNVYKDMILFNYLDRVFAKLKRGEQPELSLVVRLAHPERGFDAKKMQAFKDCPRDLSDIFNVFSVNTVSRSFTDVEELIDEYLSDNNFYQKKSQLLALSKLREDWKCSFTDSFLATLEDLEQRVQAYEKQRTQKLRQSKSISPASFAGSRDRKSSKRLQEALAFLMEGK